MFTVPFRGVFCPRGNARKSWIQKPDELGFGMRKMMLYGKKYGASDPQLIEGDNFRMIISVPEFWEAGEDETAPAGYKMTEVGVIPEDWELKPLATTSANPTASCEGCSGAQLRRTSSLAP